MNWLQELKKGTAILVTGTPGTGKTTISHLLAKALQTSYVNPLTLLTRIGIDYTYDKNRLTRIVSPKKLQGAVIALARRTDRGLVIDTHIVFHIVPPLRLERAIVLRCNPTVLEERLKRKHWSKHKIGENLLAEILDICLSEAVREYGWHKISEIDTTDKRPNRVVQLAIRSLEERGTQRQARVDWLGSLKRQRLLARYLA